ncbi:hypothetical protein M513_08808 [Trichuris suis]|uniref:Uncharacterized protein n=1 Tax=Trichuris suis TaxID=68888 RepID=A0A085LZB2_9BILA|nr:hypothetical protein M513_08808 [Trichuris suis]
MDFVFPSVRDDNPRSASRTAISSGSGSPRSLRQGDSANALVFTYIDPRTAKRLPSLRSGASGSEPNRLAKITLRSLKPPWIVAITQFAVVSTGGDHCWPWAVTTATYWSRDGRKILTAGAEKTVVLTDVLSGDSEGHFAFSSTVACLQINPRRRSQFLICQVKQQAMLMNIDGQRTIIHDDSENGVEANIVASFDKRGDYIISGTVKGKVTIHDVNTLQLLAYFRQPGGYCIRSLEVARRGSLFMTNSNDRVIRVYDLNDVKNGGKDSSVLPIQKVQDSVNSGDSEYICAGSSGTHALYIWERSSGSVVKFLHGSKGEQVLDMVWHPVRTAVFSVSNGKLALWSHCRSENWSAFAPDFKELAENVEYEERESEFDLEDEDKSPPNLEESAIKDGSVEVDIESVDYMRTFFSSDDDEDPLRLICCMPEIEDPEESVSEVLTEHPEAHMPRSSNAVNVSSFPFRIDLPAFSYAIPTNSDTQEKSSWTLEQRFLSNTIYPKVVAAQRPKSSSTYSSTFQCE